MKGDTPPRLVHDVLSSGYSSVSTEVSQGAPKHTGPERFLIQCVSALTTSVPTDLRL